jgi:hypothetical protein
MTTLHTPGPWHIGIGNGIGSIFPDNGRTRLEDGGTTLYPIASVNSGWNADEDTANADLIAAAPELLAALTALVDYLEGYDEDYPEARPVFEQAYTAITKAGGWLP